MVAIIELLSLEWKKPRIALALLLALAAMDLICSLQLLEA